MEAGARPLQPPVLTARVVQAAGPGLVLAFVSLAACQMSAPSDPTPAPSRPSPPSPAAPAPAPEAPHRGRVHTLKIGTFAPGVLSQAEAQAAIAAMNAAMQGNSGLCPRVRFTLTRGPESSAGALPGFVGGGNWSAFARSPYSINVVSQILECGPHVVVGGQSFGGCTTVGSVPVTVVPSTLQTRPVLWLHELGHSQGLGDRCRDESCAGNVMAGILNASNTRLSGGECQAMFAPQHFRIRITDELHGDPVRTVRQLLELRWNHDMPVEALTALTPAQVDTVRDILRRRPAQGFANAVLALGLTGAAADAPLIRSVLEASALRDGSIAFDVVDAKLNVPVALGYLANRTGDSGTIDRLAELRDPRQNTRFFTDLGEDGMTLEYGRALARNVAVGAALSQGAEGRALLAALTEESRSRQIALGVDDGYLSRLAELSRREAAKGIAEILIDARDATP